MTAPARDRCATRNWTIGSLRTAQSKDAPAPAGGPNIASLTLARLTQLYMFYFTVSTPMRLESGEEVLTLRQGGAYLVSCAFYYNKHNLLIATAFSFPRLAPNLMLNAPTLRSRPYGRQPPSSILASLLLMVVLAR
jgi:hypothetical protein